MNDDHNPEVEEYVFTAEQWDALLVRLRRKYFGIDPDATTKWVSEGVGVEFL